MKPLDTSADRPALWRVGDLFASVTLRSTLATSAITGMAAVLIGLGASWLATYLLGGAQHVVPHFYYVPVLIAAIRFGPVVALMTAIVSGLLAGPLTYLEVDLQTAQETGRWVTRMVFFSTIGVGMAALVRPSLPSFSQEVRALRQGRVLREAIRQGQLFVRYQPIVHMPTGSIYALEALVRWRHPQLGELGPAAFLDDAEASGAILELDAFVFEQACHQAARWSQLAQRHGRTPPLVTVNMSSTNLESHDLIARVRDVIDDTGIDPDLLCLEVTESMLVDDFDVSTARLAGLKTLGIKLAVDDFGTGYSSLNAVHRFPADMLKVDRGFLKTMGRDPDADNLIGGIALLARAIDVTAVAEGVETLAQRDALVGYGYEIAQGFFYARPLDADEVDKLLAAAQPFAPAVADLQELAHMPAVAETPAVAATVDKRQQDRHT